MKKSLLGRLCGKPLHSTTLIKEQVKELLRLCKGDVQRECLRFGLAEAGGLSSEMIKRQFGVKMLEKGRSRFTMLFTSPQKSEKVYHLASIKEKSVLLSLGVELCCHSRLLASR